MSADTSAVLTRFCLVLLQHSLLFCCGTFTFLKEWCSCRPWMKAAPVLISPFYWQTCLCPAHGCCELFTQLCLRVHLFLDPYLTWLVRINAINNWGPRICDNSLWKIPAAHLLSHQPHPLFSSPLFSFNRFSSVTSSRFLSSFPLSSPVGQYLRKKWLDPDIGIDYVCATNETLSVER